MTAIELDGFWGLRYNFTSEPSAQWDPVTLRQKGINCRGLAHGYLAKRNDIFLPEDQLSLEIYENNAELFWDVPLEAPIQESDVVLFGKQGLKDFRWLHLGVSVGRDEIRFGRRDPLLLHATRTKNGVCLWPLSKFFEYPQYAVLYAIRRPVLLAVGAGRVGADRVV